jgi:hypothetical protein
LDPSPVAGNAEKPPVTVRLEEVMPVAEPHKVRQLGPATVLDRDDVIALESVSDAAARHCTGAVATRERGVEVRRDPPADVGNRSDIGASLDDHLGKRVSEEILDGGERYRADAGDLTELAWLELTTTQRFGAHVEHDLGPGHAGRLVRL